MSKYNVDEATLRNLHSQGLGNREISRRMDVPHWKIARELSRLELVTNVLRGRPPEKVDELHSRCAKCQSVVLNTDFPYVQGRADGRRLSYCRPCRTKQNRQALGASPESYWRDKQHRVRRNIRGHEYDMPDGYLLSLWYAQEGKCFYTDTPMNFGWESGRNHWTASVDRVDPTKGYVEGNVVICGDRINSIKRDCTLEELKMWMPDWSNRVDMWRAKGMTCLQVAPGDF